MRTVKLDPEPSPCVLPVTTSLSFLLRSSGLKTGGGVLLLASVSCFLALLSVNSDILIFHYLFAGFNCLLVSSPSGTAPSLPLPHSSSSLLLSIPPGSLCLLLPSCFQQGGEERPQVLLQPQAPGAHDQIHGFGESTKEPGFLLHIRLCFLLRPPGR